MINIHQVFFDERSRANCDNQWRVYNNEFRLTEFFENSVIIDLYKRGEHKREKYFGVFSHDVKDQIAFREDGLHFSPNNLKKIVEKHPSIDVFAFQKRRKQANIVTQADRYHPGFTAMIKKILLHAKMDPLPHRLDHIVLFNTFIATREFWEDYIESLLKPAMEILKEMPEAYEDSRYTKVSGKILSDEYEARFMKAFGKPYYPYHPFLCERLPSIFLQKRKYNFKQIF